MIRLNKNPVSLRGKNILGLEDLLPEEIQLVLESAKGMKNVIHRDIKNIARKINRHAVL